MEVISRLLPLSSKNQVIHFIQRRKPLFCDDEGLREGATEQARRESGSNRQDTVLDFEFDANGNLLKYAETEFLSFLWLSRLRTSAGIPPSPEEIGRNSQHQKY